MLFDERSGFDTEKLPEAGVHAPITGFPLLPGAQAAVYHGRAVIWS